VKRLAAKEPDEGVPAALHGKREATVIYNNLPRILAAGRARAERVAESSPEYGDERLTLAIEIDRVMCERAPAGWKGGNPRTVRTRQESTGLLMAETIQLGEIAIAVRRKDIKHVHLSVHPPSGRVTLVAPNGTRSEVARAYPYPSWDGSVTSRRRWEGRRGKALSAIRSGGRGEALRPLQSPQHHTDRASRQQRREARGGNT
jgi:hypothetical protein